MTMNLNISQSMEWQHKSNNKLCLFPFCLLEKCSLTLFRMGGPLWPGQLESVCRFHRVRDRLTKVLDFVLYKIYQVLWKSFLEFFFWNFWKTEFQKFWGSSSVSRKLKKLKKNCIFWRKLYFFLLNMNCICSQLFFEVYNIYVAKKFEILIFFAWKISFLIFVIRWPGTTKIYYKWGCFWCLWKAKDRNICLKASFDT